MRPVVQFRHFPIWSSDAFVEEYSLVDLSWHHEVVLTFGGDQVKVMGMTQDKYERRFLHWNLQATQAVPFQRGGNFEPPCQILRRITDIWSPSSSERHSKWGNMSWSHKCERRIIFENLLGTNAVNFRGVDTFQQLHTSFVPWGERQHRGEVDRHCLALFCWRKAHCCLQIRVLVIGHFFKNYIWLHSLHAFSGPMHVPHAGWITARQSRPYRIKESFHIVGCKVDSPRSMHWFAKIHCIDWQLLPCCCRWQLLPK